MREQNGYEQPSRLTQGEAGRTFLRGCCRNHGFRLQHAAHSCRVPGVGPQLVSETGCLTLPLHHTEPVLERFGSSTLLLERIGIQAVLVPGHIPDHCLALVAVIVTGAGPEHLGIAVLELSLPRCIG